MSDAWLEARVEVTLERIKQLDDSIKHHPTVWYEIHLDEEGYEVSLTTCITPFFEHFGKGLWF